MASTDPLARSPEQPSWRRTAPAAALCLLLLSLVMAVVLAFTRPVTAAGPTYVSGPITASTTWVLADSPYIVTGDVLVQDSAVLTIEAGVTVQFTPSAALYIGNLVTFGGLVAVGTPGQPITFTAYVPSGTPSRGYWDGIEFKANSFTNTLQYCLIEYAGTGIFSNDSDGHVIDHCTLRHNGTADPGAGGAISIDGDVVTISNNEIYDNELGIRLRKSDQNEITGNAIYDNDGYGIGFIQEGGSGGSNNLISGNQIYDNGGHGVSLDLGWDNQLLVNEIYGNGGHGVWANAQGAMQLIGNIIRANGLNGFTYAAPQDAPTALHSNVLCSNAGFDLLNGGVASLTAAGNWFGTNTPANGSEITGTVVFAPWISMAVAAEPTTLLADGADMATLTTTMSSGAYTVPDGYTLTVSASEGSVSPPTVSLVGGEATTTYTAGVVPGGVDIYATDQCATLVFSDVLVLQAYLDLVVAKSDDGLIVDSNLDYSIEYTILVSNTGLITAENVVLTDVIPLEATYTGTDWACTGNECSYTLGTLNPSETIQVLLPLELDKSALGCPVVLTNTVQVTDTVLGGDLNPTDNVYTLTSTFDCVPDLVVTKSEGGLIVGPGQDYSVEYTILVTNSGLITANNVVLTDVLPIGATYGGTDWTCAGNECTHVLGTLNPSQVAQVQLPVELDENLLGCPIVITNTVRVTHTVPGVDLDPTDNVYTLTSTFECAPDLVVVKNDNVGGPPLTDSKWVFDMLDVQPDLPVQQACVYPGQWISYTIAYVNTGFFTATQVVLTETLPAHTSYMGGGWSWAGGDTYTKAVGTVAASEGDVTYFIVRVDTIPADMHVENEVRIAGAEDDMNWADNVSYDDTLICEGLFLQIRKEDNTSCAFPGDMIRYTIVFTNPSGLTASGVVLTETLPANTSYLLSPGWTSIGGGLYTYDYGDLAPYASDSVDFAVVVDDPLPPTVLQTVNLVCIGYDGPAPPGNCYSLITPLPIEPDLRVIKHDHIGPPPPNTQQQLDRFYQKLYGHSYRPPTSVQQMDPVGPGDVFSYTITYLNLGRADATGVVLTETIPEHTSYVGFGWTQVSGNIYTRTVGTLHAGYGGQTTIWVQVEPDVCEGDGFLYNWVRIAGNEAECNTRNNWSGEETQADCRMYQLYLPLILNGFDSSVLPPTPEPSPEPSPPPEPELVGYVSDVEVNPETNRVYVASPERDEVLVVDPAGAGSVMAAVPVGEVPMGLAVVTTTNKIYAANKNSWTLTAIRGSDNARLADIYVGAQAVKAAADSADGRVYVTNHLESDNGAAAVNSQTDTREYYYSRLHATQGRYGVDVDAARDQLFIAARDAGLIAILDAYLPNQEPWVFKLDPARVPFVVAFNPTTEHLFVTAADDNLAVVLDPYSIQWNRGRWITIDSQPVFLLNRANAGWIKEIGVGLGAEEGVAVNPVTGYVYVTNAESDTVSIIRDHADPAQIQWVMDLPVGEKPQGVAVDSKTNTIYVGNADSKDLSVIDGATHTVVKTIPLD